MYNTKLKTLKIPINKGGEKIMKKITLAICLFVVAAAGSAVVTGSVAAQTATPTSAVETTVTPSPTTSVPAGAPETGRR